MKQMLLVLIYMLGCCPVISQAAPFTDTFAETPQQPVFVATNSADRKKRKSSSSPEKDRGSISKKRLKSDDGDEKHSENDESETSEKCGDEHKLENIDKKNVHFDLENNAAESFFIQPITFFEGSVSKDDMLKLSKGKGEKADWVAAARAGITEDPDDELTIIHIKYKKPHLHMYHIKRGNAEFYINEGIERLLKTKWGNKPEIETIIMEQIIQIGTKETLKVEIEKLNERQDYGTVLNALEEYRDLHDFDILIPTDKFIQTPLGKLSKRLADERGKMIKSVSVINIIAGGPTVRVELKKAR